MHSKCQAELKAIQDMLLERPKNKSLTNLVHISLNREVPPLCITLQMAVNCCKYIYDVLRVWLIWDYTNYQSMGPKEL